MLIKKLSNDQKTFNSLMGGTLNSISKVANIMVHYHMITKSRCKQLADALNLGLKAINNIKGMSKEIPRVMVRDYLMVNPKCSNQTQDILRLHCQRLDNLVMIKPLKVNILLASNVLTYDNNDKSKITKIGKLLNKVTNKTKRLLVISNKVTANQ